MKTPVVIALLSGLYPLWSAADYLAVAVIIVMLPIIVFSPFR